MLKRIITIFLSILLISSNVNSTPNIYNSYKITNNIPGIVDITIHGADSSTIIPFYNTMLAMQTVSVIYDSQFTGLTQFNCRLLNRINGSTIPINITKQVAIGRNSMLDFYKLPSAIFDINTQKWIDCENAIIIDSIKLLN